MPCQGAGSARLKRGWRVISSSSATFTSRRARFEPRQRWAPTPNEVCGLVARSSRISFGASNRSGSRFAAPNTSTTRSPAFMSTPPTTASRFNVRAMACTGQSVRRYSSVAAGDWPAVLGQIGKVIGVLSEMPQRAADRARRRLQTGDEQQVDDVEHFVVGQRSAVELRSEQTRDHVGSRVGTALRDERSKVVVDLVRSVACDTLVVGSGEHDQLDPDIELSSVLNRKAAVLAEHHRRQHSRIHRCVEGRVAGRVVEELAGDLSCTWKQCVHSLWSEERQQDLAITDEVRWIDVERYQRTVGAERRKDHRRGNGERLPVVLCRVNRFVRCDRPEAAVAIAPRHRAAFVHRDVVVEDRVKRGPVKVEIEAWGMTIGHRWLSCQAMTRRRAGVDDFGLSVTADGPATVATWRHAYDELLSFTGDPISTLSTVNETDTSFVMGPVFNAAYRLLGGAQPTHPLVLADLDRLSVREHLGDDRERGHIAALRLLHSGEFLDAAERWDQITQEYPHDFTAYRFVHDVCLHIGDDTVRVPSARRAAEVWPTGSRGRGLAEGMLAFALEEVGDYDSAEGFGRSALAMSEGDAWARHALAHVYESTGRHDDAIELLLPPSDRWTQQNLFSNHLWWHVGLRLLNHGDTDGAIAMSDAQLRSVTPFGLADSTSLLWRLQLAGADVGDRWLPQVDAWSRCDALNTCGFLDLHAALAFAAANDLLNGSRLRDGAARRGERSVYNGRTFQGTIVPLVTGVLAFGEDDLRSARVNS